MVPADQQLALIRRGCVEIIKEEDLAARLATGKPLRVKAGFDPTAPDLHLGHLVLFEKLRQFQELGHVPVVIMGDFTARVGDPSGHDQTRPTLSPAEIERNTERFLQQLGKVLNLKGVEIRRNSDWISRIGREGVFGFLDWLSAIGAPPIQRLLEREEFQKRKERREPIYIQQLLYPLFQAYDSVCVQADVELGGTDQKFNLLLGREVQQTLDQPPQVAVLLPLLVGTDGTKKMSKSLGNHVALEDSPVEMFGKVMSIGDSVMKTYYELLTSETVDDGHPMEAKKRLASLVVGRLHGAASAAEAARDFTMKFQKKELPEDMPEVRLPATGAPLLLCDAMAGPLGLAPSKSEARRLIRQKGVRINEQTVDDEKALLPLEDGLVVQVGRRKFVKVRIVK
ncbi:MAG: tyrosine--tRNA ligase [Nitrospirae bacterium]|nr:tyrosine--tRNA ligase [Nitrospirota bacterium]